MQAKSCRIRIELAKMDQQNLKQHRFSNCALKRRFIGIIYELLRKGYKHLVIDINCPTDYWLAELIYSISIVEKSMGVRYSIGLQSEENTSIYDWMFDEPLCERILLSAYQVYYRKKEWYVRKYRTIIYQLTTHDLKKYELK